MINYIKQIKSIGFSYYLIVFCAVFFSQDTLLFGTNSNQSFLLIGKAMPFILIAFLIIFAFIKNIKMNIKVFIPFLLICILPFTSCLYNGEPINNYIYRLAIMICAFLFAVTNKNHSFPKAFNMVMSFLTIWSLAFFFAINIFPTLIDHFPKVINTGGVPFYSSFFATIQKSQSYGIYRNGGFSREPGVFAVLLIVSLIMELFVIEKINKKRCVLFFAGLISTLSTAGLIVGALLILLVLISKNIVSKKTKKIIFVLFCAMVLLFVFLSTNNSTFESVFSKLEYGNKGYGSFLARYQSIVGNIRLTLKSPFFGIGRYKLYDTILYIDPNNSNYTVYHNTNTIMIGFSAFGILFGTLCTTGIVLFARQRIKMPIVVFLIFALLFMAFSNEDFGQNVLYYFIVFSGFVQFYKKKDYKSVNHQLLGTSYART